MKAISVILLFVFTLSLGGVQLFLTTGKNMARQRALKFQRIRKNQRNNLETLVFDADIFAEMETEDVGNGVFEFEFQGSKYDAFEMVESNGKVRILVKKDGLETAIGNALKHVKRYTRAQGEQVKNTLFNFYFAPIFQSLSAVFRHRVLLLDSLTFDVTDSKIGLDSPPPEVLN